MITCVLWDVESQELDRRPRGPNGVLSNSRDSISHSAQVIIVYPSFKTCSRPLSQSEPNILMLYIPLTVLIHEVMVASCAGK